MYVLQNLAHKSHGSVPMLWEFLGTVIEVLKRCLQHHCLHPAAEGLSNYLSYSCCSCAGRFLNLLLGCTTYWFKFGRRPWTSPGLVTLKAFSVKAIFTYNLQVRSYLNNVR